MDAICKTAFITPDVLLGKVVVIDMVTLKFTKDEFLLLNKMLQDYECYRDGADMEVAEDPDMVRTINRIAQRIEET